MNHKANITVGIINVEDGPNRVTVIVNSNAGVTLSTKVARHVAAQLIAAADFIENNEENTDD